MKCKCCFRQIFQHCKSQPENVTQLRINVLLHCLPARIYVVLKVQNLIASNLNSDPGLVPSEISKSLYCLSVVCLWCVCMLVCMYCMYVNVAASLSLVSPSIICILSLHVFLCLRDAVLYVFMQNCMLIIVFVLVCACMSLCYLDVSSILKWFSSLNVSGSTVLYVSRLSIHDESACIATLYFLCITWVARLCLHPDAYTFYLCQQLQCGGEQPFILPARGIEPSFMNCKYSSLGGQ